MTKAPCSHFAFQALRTLGTSLADAADIERLVFGGLNERIERLKKRIAADKAVEARLREGRWLEALALADEHGISLAALEFLPYTARFLCEGHQKIADGIRREAPPPDTVTPDTVTPDTLTLRHELPYGNS